MKRIVAALLLLIPLCGCEALRGKPPGKRDNESYSLLKAELPPGLAGAPVIAEWRGFTDVRDASGDGWEQCAVIVYDLKGKDVDGFVAQLKDNLKRDPQARTYELRNWMMSEDLKAAGHDSPPGELVEQVARPGYAPLGAGFCGMPEAQRKPLADKAQAAMSRAGSPVLADDQHYGGGVGWSGDRVGRDIVGVIDIEEQRFYAWLKVTPNNGY